MQLRILMLILVTLSLPCYIIAQSVGVGTSTPNTSALLDVNSTSKGLLPPRMSSEQRLAIIFPAAGLVVFDTDAKSLFLYDDQQWRALSTTDAGQSATYNYDKTLKDPSSVADSGLIGLATTIWGNWAAISAPGRRVGGLSTAGKVYLYHRSGNDWSLADSLAPPLAQEGGQFGVYMVLKGNYLVVGMPGYYASTPTEKAGGIYVYFYNGTTWTLQTSSPIVPPGTAGTSAKLFSVDIDSLGQTLLVGDRNAEPANEGVVYSYKRTGITWGTSPTSTLLMPGSEVTYSYYGRKVAITNSRDFMAVSCDRDTLYDGKPYRGCVDIYSRSVDTWNLAARLWNPISSDDATGQFGYSLVFAEHPEEYYDYDIFVGLDLPERNLPSRIMMASKPAIGTWSNGNLSDVFLAFQKGLGQFDIFVTNLTVIPGYSNSALIAPSTERANIKFTNLSFAGPDPFIDFTQHNYNLATALGGNHFACWDNYFVIGRPTALGNLQGDIIFGRFYK